MRRRHRRAHLTVLCGISFRLLYFHQLQHTLRAVSNSFIAIFSFYSCSSLLPNCFIFDTHRYTHHNWCQQKNKERNLCLKRKAFFFSLSFDSNVLFARSGRRFVWVARLCVFTLRSHARCAHLSSHLSHSVSQFSGNSYISITTNVRTHSCPTPETSWWKIE